MPRTRQNRFRTSSKPQRSRRVTRRTPIEGEDGGTQIETTTTTKRGSTRRVERREPISTGGSQTTVESESIPASRGRRTSIPSPTSAGTKASGIGLLEAEFLGSMALLVLLLFADLNKSYPDKIMSTMKRGTLIALLFFILALIAGTGPNAARISKAIGAMVVIGILVTSPVLNMIGNIDKFFRADWVGTSEHGSDVGATSNTSDTGSSTTGGTAGALHAAEGAINRITQIIQSFGFGIIK